MYTLCGVFFNNNNNNNNNNNTNSVRSGQTDPTDCGTHTYDAAARPLIAKTVANESKT